MVVLRKDNGLWISKGDTAQIDLHFGYDVPQNGTVCVMSLKEYTSRAAVIWEKEQTIEGGIVSFIIASSDTDNLASGDYKWDVRLYYIDGTVLTPFTPATFKILDVVGNIKATGNTVSPLRAQHMDISIHNDTHEVDVKVVGGTRLDVIEYTVADKLANARTIRLTGDISGEVDFDGSEDVELETSVKDITSQELEELFNG